MSILPNKFFKVTLPLATAATATIITTYLIISTGADKDKSKEEDQALENIELKSKEFEEELIKGPEESEKNTKQDSPDKEDTSKEKSEKDKDLEKQKPDQEVSTIEEAKAILSNVGQEIIDHMKQSETTNKADQVHIKVSDPLNKESSSAKETSQAKAPQLSENKEGNPPTDKDEKDEETGLGTNKEQIGEEGTPGQEEQDLSSEPKVPQSIQESEEAPNMEGTEEKQKLVDKNEPSLEQSEVAEGDTVQGEEEFVDQGSGDRADSSSSAEDRQLEEDASESRLSGDAGEENSDGSNDNGGAKVENLKLFENLKQQLFNQIDSMKRFL